VPRNPPAALRRAGLTELNDMFNDGRIRRKIHVAFNGERGADAGGLTTDFYASMWEACVVRTGFLPEEEKQSGEQVEPVQDDDGAPVKLFEGRKAMRFLPTTTSNCRKEEQLRDMHTMGVLLAKTIFDGRSIPGYLAPSVFKFLCSVAPNKHDLSVFDPEFDNSLTDLFLLDAETLEMYGLDFEEVSDGKITRSVTAANLYEYVQAKVEHVLVNTRLASLMALKDGFEEALDKLDRSKMLKRVLLSLSPIELELLTSASLVVYPSEVLPLLRVEGFGCSSQIETWLRNIINRKESDWLKMLLYWSTGQTSLPRPPMKEYLKFENAGRPVRDDSIPLPMAHTCFHSVDLPQYLSEEQLEDRLTFAIRNTAGFQFA